VSAVKHGSFLFAVVGRWLAFLLVGGLLVVSCGGGDGSDDGTPGASLDDCIAEDGYPCRRDQVDAAVLELEGEHADRLAELLEEGTREDAYAWIRAQEGVVETFLDETTLMFRVDGGMPVVSIDSLGAAPPGAAAPSSEDAQGAASVRFEPPDSLPPVLASESDQIGAGSAGELPNLPDAGVVGDGTDRDNSKNRKKALILTPFEWQRWSMFEVPAEASPTEILREIPDYSHDPSDVKHVTDENVTPKSFQGWEAYDVLFVQTHGGNWSSGQWIASGVKAFWGAGPGITFTSLCSALTAGYSGIVGLSCGWINSGGDRYVVLGMLPRFFNEEYGQHGGLDKAIIYVGGCFTADTQVADALAGSSSAYLGWTDNVWIHEEPEAAQALLWLLARDAPTGRLTVLQALLKLHENGLGSGVRFGVNSPALKIRENGDEPKKLRLYDLPTLRDPKTPTSGGPGLQDGAQLKIKGTPGDGENDQLELAVEVIGVIDPEDTSAGDANVMRVDGALDLHNRSRLNGRGQGIGAALSVAQAGDARDLYNLRFLIGDDEEELGADNLGRVLNPTAAVEKLGDTTYRYTFTADLPFDVDPEGTETSLKVVVDLPEGGISDYEVDVTLVGSTAVCDIVEPARDRLLAAFGSSVPFYESGTEFTDNSCVFRLEYPWGPDQPDSRAFLYFERAPAIKTRVEQRAEELDGPRTPIPSLGETAVAIEDPLGLQPHVIFEFGGRVYDVYGEYDPLTEGSAPVDALIGVAEIFLELLADASPAV